MLHAQDTLTCLNHYWGYPDLRPAQKPVIAEVMQGNSALVIMPTGGGKSMCYQLPAMLRSGLTLVISPLIALMKDQVDDLRLKGIDAAYLNSSQSTGESNLIFNAIGDGKMKLLYIAPERLMSLKGALLERLKTIKIDMIAVDEAHCISSWGHDFRPAYTKLKDLSEHFPGVPVLALTATADDATKRDIIRQLGLENAALFENSFDRPEIHYSAQARTDEVTQLLAFVEQHASESGIVYCLSRKRTQEMADHLKAAGYKAECYHAGLSSQERMERQEQFIRDEINIMVATIAFGMGIDKNNVRYVVHMNLPKNIEGYYQETGRAGRDGLDSKALLLHGGGDFRTLSAHCEVDGNLDQSNVMLGKLRRMQDFADSRVCRRKILLQYFGEELQEDCGNCDNCETTFEEHDGTEDAQKLLSTVARLEWSYGLAHIVDILRGSTGPKNHRSAKRIVHLRHRSRQKQTALDEHRKGIDPARLADPNRRQVSRGRTQRPLLGSPPGPGAGHAHQVRRKPSPSKKRANLKPPPSRPAPNTKRAFKSSRRAHQLAKASNVPAYLVLSDRSLKELCTALPATVADLDSVHGFGKVKIAKFGLHFLDALKEEAD